MALGHIPKPCEPIELGEFLVDARKFPAVYFLYHRGEVVYVGQSRTLTLRVEGHLSEAAKVFDAVAFIRCHFNQLTRIEGHYIRALAPKYNNCSLSKKVRERESWKLIPNRRHLRRSKFEAPFPDGPAQIEFIDAAECIIPDSDIGEFLQVRDRAAAEWRSDGKIRDTSIIGLLTFVAANHRDVSRAQDDFEQL